MIWLLCISLASHSSLVLQLNHVKLQIYECAIHLPLCTLPLHSLIIFPAAFFPTLISYFLLIPQV